MLLFSGVVMFTLHSLYPKAKSALFTFAELFRISGLI